MTDELNLRWSELVIVCRDCRKRSRGPDAKAKAVAAAFKERARTARPRPRIVLSTCLGLCPREATAVVMVKDHGASKAVAIKRMGEIAKLK